MNRYVSTLAAMLIGIAPHTTLAQDASHNPYGSAFRLIHGDTLSERTGILVIGWADATIVGARATDATGNLNNGAFFNQENGLTLNQLGFQICRSAGCPIPVAGPQNSVIGRVGPFPGPKVERLTFGYNITAVYCEDPAFFRTAGVDDFTFDDGRENRFAIPQAFVDLSLPILDGASLIAGQFFTSASGTEIGLPYSPSNWFTSRIYALQHGPATHTGLLFSTKVPTSVQIGSLGFEVGLVAGTILNARAQHSWGPCAGEALNLEPGLISKLSTGMAKMMRSVRRRAALHTSRSVRQERRSTGCIQH